MRLLVDIADRIVTRLAVERTVEPRIEFLYDVCEGLPPARQKRIILRARDPSVDFLTESEATILIDSLGLADA